MKKNLMFLPIVILLILAVFFIYNFNINTERSKSNKISHSKYNIKKEEKRLSSLWQLIENKVNIIESKKNNFNNHLKPKQVKPMNNSEHPFLSDKEENNNATTKLTIPLSEKKKRMKGIIRSDSPDEFMRFHAEIRTRYGEEKLAYEPNYTIKEYDKAFNSVREDKYNHALADVNWTERGPANVGGRTRSIIVDPDDPTHKTWFAGSVSGGIWKTTNMGATWSNKTPNLPNIATCALAMAESNHNIIYAGTGEGFANVDLVSGNGIFKTTDKGETWFQLNSTTDTVLFNNINRIVIDPKNPDIVLCCSNNLYVSDPAASRFYLVQSSCIHKSLDGGGSWNKVYDGGKSSVQQILADPQNFNNLYASVNGKGVIKSTNAGDTWTFASDSIEQPSRIEMAIAPTDPSRLYLSVERGGISDLYVSYDAGNKWYKAEDSTRGWSWLGGQGWYDNTIIVHPFDKDIVYVGGISIFKIRMLPGTNSVNQILSIVKSNLNSYMTFYNAKLPYEGGSLGKGVDFWKDSAGIVNANDYVTAEIRFGPGLKQKAHRFVDTGKYVYKNFVEVPFQVWDLKNNRQLMVSFKDCFDNGKFDLSDSNKISEYIFIHAVPYNANVPSNNITKLDGARYKNIFVVCPQLKKGILWEPDSLPDSKITIHYGTYLTKIRKTYAITDGYGNYGNRNNNNVIHVDHHYLLAEPIDKSQNKFWLITGNDGGVGYSTDDGVTWTETDKNGYNTSQFYGMDKCPGEDLYIGGTQDNGTWRTPWDTPANAETKYEDQIGGDGFEVSWHYWDSQKILGSSQFNNIMRTTNGGISWNSGTNGLGDVGSSRGIFITKIGKSQIDPDLVFAVGKSGVWRSENFASSWSLIPIPDSVWSSGGYMNTAQVKISLANPQIVWAGANMSPEGRINVSTDGGLSFSPTENYSEVTMGRLTGLETHPTDENTAYGIFSMSYAPKILRTTDLGQTWEDITGFGKDSVSKTGFPNVATFCLVVMPFNTNIMWAGTEIGLFETTDGGGSWHYANNGLPAVSIWQMRIVDDQVVVGTHGRGIWSVTLPELAGYKPPEVILAPNIIAAGQAPNGNLVIKANLRSIYDRTEVYSNGELLMTYGQNNILENRIFSINYPITQEDTLSVSLISYKDGKQYKTGSFNLIMYPLNPFQFSYENNFDNSVATDFGGSGFSMLKPKDFDNAGINSAHPYPNNSESYYMLLTPIVVADTNPDFKYDDIVVVEPGDSGAVFGTDRFWDYVIVEATSDGLEWKPLLDGYDSNFDSAWLAAFNGDTSITPDLFRNHIINFQEIFAPHDTILIRFRLFADTYTNGWGWLIDNLEIQKEGIVSVETAGNSLHQAKIIGSYPNPFSDFTTIEFFLNKSVNIRLEAYNLQGEKVCTLASGLYSVGGHEAIFNATNLAKGVYIIKLIGEGFSDAVKVVVVK